MVESEQDARCGMCARSLGVTAQLWETVRALVLQGSVCGRTPICAKPTILKIVDGLVGHAQATAQVRAPVRKPYVVRHKLGFVFCRCFCCGASVVSVDSLIYFLQLEGAHLSPATGDLPNFTCPLLRKSVCGRLPAKTKTDR